MLKPLIEQHKIEKIEEFNAAVKHHNFMIDISHLFTAKIGAIKKLGIVKIGLLTLKKCVQDHNRATTLQMNKIENLKMSKIS